MCSFIIAAQQCFHARDVISEIIFATELYVIYKKKTITIFTAHFTKIRYPILKRDFAGADSCIVK